MQHNNISYEIEVYYKKIDVHISTSYKYIKNYPIVLKLLRKNKNTLSLILVRRH